MIGVKPPRTSATVPGALRIAGAILGFALLLLLASRATPPDPVDAFLASLPEVQLGPPVLRLGGESWSSGQFYYAVDGAAIVDGEYAVVFDALDRRIHSYTLDGERLASWGGSGYGPGEFVDLEGAIGPDGEIVAWDPGQRRLTHFDRSGRILESDRMVRGARFPHRVGRGLGPCHWMVPNLDREARTLVQCLRDGRNVRALQPAGRWVEWDDGTFTASAPGAPDPDPLEEAGTRFVWDPAEALPLIEGSWSDPEAGRWVRARGQVVLLDASGFVRGILPEEDGRVVSIRDGIAAFTWGEESGNPVVTFRRVGVAEPPADSEPRLFAPGVVSTEAPEFATAFSASGDTVWFNRTPDDRSRLDLFYSVRTPDGWGEPRLFEPTVGIAAIDPFLDPGSGRLYFSSDLEGASPNPSFDLWFVEPREEGWSAPIALPAPVNGDSSEVFNSITRSGEMIFSSRRDGVRRIYSTHRSVDGSGERWSTPELVRFGTVDAGSNAVVSREGDFIVFARSSARGDSDLFVSCREGVDGWTDPVDLGPTVNSVFTDFAPALTATDLYFTSERPGVVDAVPDSVRPPGDIYRVGLEVVTRHCPRR